MSLEVVKRHQDDKTSLQLTIRIPYIMEDWSYFADHKDPPNITKFGLSVRWGIRPF